MAPPSRNAAQLAGLRSGQQNLMLFGGDRKQAIETLVASGAKAENPKVAKPISANQTITSKVKVKNFQVDPKLVDQLSNTPPSSGV